MNGMSWVSTASSRVRSLPTVRVGGRMSSEPGFAAAEHGEHGEGQQLAGRHVEAMAADVVAEAVGGQEPLQVLLVVGGVGVEGVDPSAPTICFWTASP